MEAKGFGDQTVFVLGVRAVVLFVGQFDGDVGEESVENLDLKSSVYVVYVVYVY